MIEVGLGEEEGAAQRVDIGCVGGVVGRVEVEELREVFWRRLSAWIKVMDADEIRTFEEVHDRELVTVVVVES